MLWKFNSVYDPALLLADHGRAVEYAMSPPPPPQQTMDPERLYVLPRVAGQPIQCGVLIYTATAGNQGTLGGLVEVTRRFIRLLKSALERERLCSGDPVCADHDPATAEDDRTLHGAACHGCLLVAETSCEARNLFLDRALIVDTVGQTGAGFF